MGTFSYVALEVVRSAVFLQEGLIESSGAWQRVFGLGMRVNSLPHSSGICSVQSVTQDSALPSVQGHHGKVWTSALFSVFAW